MRKKSPTAFVYACILALVVSGCASTDESIHRGYGKAGSILQSPSKLAVLAVLAAAAGYALKDKFKRTFYYEAQHGKKITLYVETTSEHLRTALENYDHQAAISAAMLAEEYGCASFTKVDSSESDVYRQPYANFEGKTAQVYEYTCSNQPDDAIANLLENNAKTVKAIRKGKNLRPFSDMARERATEADTLISHTSRQSTRSSQWNSETLRVQQALIANGYDITADGIFGKQTSNALAQYQTAHNIPSSGVLDNETRAILLP